MVWTPEKIEELTRLWSEGLSITQIGKQLGLTRNAVVGKAHRLGLSKRPSPIIRSEAKTAQGGTRCKWPIGDPRSSEFGFCGKPAVQGRPYCAEHCAAAYAGWSEPQKSADAA
jgi:GcrA cell cycle regulator